MRIPNEIVASEGFGQCLAPRLLVAAVCPADLAPRLLIGSTVLGDTRPLPFGKGHVPRDVPSLTLFGGDNTFVVYRIPSRTMSKVAIHG